MNRIETYYLLRVVIKSLDRTIRWGRLDNKELINDLAHEREMWNSILLAIETDADDADEVIHNARTELINSITSYR